MKITKYRWTILFIYVLVTISIEIQWLSHAAIARPAAAFYTGQISEGSFFNIDFLAMVYMLMFLILSFPASYAINRFGTRKTLAWSSFFLAFFSVVKALFSGNFFVVILAQTGLAAAQPFILNAVTTVSARWFPIAERALVAGLLALAQYIGIIIAMLVGPVLVGSNPDLPGYGSGIPGMLWIYGIFSVVSAVMLIIFMRESPAGYENEAILNQDSFGKILFKILQIRDMQLILVLFLIGLGIFNAISSMTDSIAASAGVKDSDGLIGGLMLIGGILGALILPALSDKFMKRRLFMIICLLGMLPGILGFAFAGFLGLDVSKTYQVLLISSFVVGFFMMSAGPIGFQYAAEITHPAPESASQGLILWIGQLSGMFFVWLMSFNNNSFLQSALFLFVGLSFLAVLSVFFLKESKLVKN
ncbi:MAG: MFS transporter [Bacteroidales bacterium]